MRFEHKKTKWYELSEMKKQYLSYNFVELRENFERFNDDRKVFCDVYDMLIYACDEMSVVDNNLIRLAFNRIFEDKFCQLKSIASKFEV